MADKGMPVIEDGGAVFFCIGCQSYFQIFHAPCLCTTCKQLNGLKAWVTEHMGETKH